MTTFLCAKRKTDRHTQGLSFAPAPASITAVFAPETHPCQGVEKPILLNNSRELRVVQFSVAQIILGRPSVLKTLKNRTVVLANTVASVYGAVVWQIDFVYVFQSQPCSSGVLRFAQSLSNVAAQ